MEEEVDVHFTDREWWTLIHGMGFGALFLLGFAGGLAGLYRDPAPDSPDRPSWPTAPRRTGTTSAWSGKSTSPGSAPTKGPGTSVLVG
jgi:hypothetical protein